MNTTWEKPPQTTGRGSVRSTVHREIAAQLRTRPGEWARIRDDGTSQAASYINKGTVAAYQPAGDYEAVSRRNTDGKTFTVWARYVGTSTTEATS